MSEDKKYEYTLSHAHTDQTQTFDTAAKAGRAFADTNGADGPRVVESDGRAARTIASTVSIDHKLEKSVPSLEEQRKDPVNLDDKGMPKEGMGRNNIEFWTGYHERVAEKAKGEKASSDAPEAAKEAGSALDKDVTAEKAHSKPQEAKEAQTAPTLPDTAKDAPTASDKDVAAEKARSEPEVKPQEAKKAQPSAEATVSEGVIEPNDPGKQDQASEKKFDTPTSYADRFVITKGKDQQEFFRSYDDQKPAIVDQGDKLSTKNADRATAMDMIELADHRGWQSLKARGPEDFRREMWIEGQAHGIKVTGYRATEKDQEEANRRAEMVQARVIERTDKQGKETGGQQNEPRITLKGEQSNVVQMPVVDFEKGVQGRISEIGSAPYRDREGADPVPYVRLEQENGTKQTLWSVTLPDAVERNDLKVGDKATFYSPGTEPVTYKTKDKKTGEVVERQGERRMWEAKDVQRAVEAPQKKDEPSLIENDRGASSQTQSPEAPKMANKERQQDTPSDRLEDRIKKYEPGDTQVKGAASALSRMDREMRAAGVSEKDREAARNEASKILAEGVSKGTKYPVQKLPNVTQEQVAQAQKASREASQPAKVQERTNENAERGNRER